MHQRVIVVEGVAGHGTSVVFQLLALHAGDTAGHGIAADFDRFRSPSGFFYRVEDVVYKRFGVAVFTRAGVNGECEHKNLLVSSCKKIM
jgi:hypothetical protein